MAHNNEITNIYWERVGSENYEHMELRGRDHYGHIHVLESKGGQMGINVHKDFDKNFHSQKEIFHFDNDASSYIYHYDKYMGWCIENPEDRINPENDIFTSDYYKE